MKTISVHGAKGEKMRLIDVDQVVKAVHDEFDECLVWDESGETTANEFENIILQVPTVDIDAITESHERIGYDRGFRDGYAEALKETDNVPDKNVGKWIDAWRSAWDGTRHWYRECSECGYERDDDNIDKDTKFCPNCGAYMEVKE